MNKLAIYNLVNKDLNDTVDTDLFTLWINEACNICIDGAELGREKICGFREANPDRFRASVNIPMVLYFVGGNTVSSVVDHYTLPSNCLTIDSVQYLHQTLNTQIKIPKTVFDEVKYTSELRWFRQDSSIYFRDIAEAIDNVSVYYFRKTLPIILDTDSPDFDENYHHIVIPYIKGKYFEAENMETNPNGFYEKFYTLLKSATRGIKPTYENTRINLSFDNGID